MRSLLKIVKLEDFEALKAFQSFCFSLVKAKSHEDFSQKVIAKQKVDRSYAGYLQDKIRDSQEFINITSNIAFYRLAADLMDIELDDVKIVYPHFRIDLPKFFADQDEKMSLPWHQEGAYYLPKGDCTPCSIVLSTTIHDCNYENGSLWVGENTQSNLIKHEGYFKDERQNKFYRVACPQPKKYIVTETKFGEVVSFDFMRPHRSGINDSDLVRLTLLIRASSKTELNDMKINYAI